MNYKLDKLPKNLVEIKLEIPYEEITKFLEKAAQEISKHQKIDGFRPGKAPYDIVKKQVGEMEILNHSLDKILSHYYVEVVKKENINPVGQPEVNIEKVAPQNPIVVNLKIALLPEVKVADYKGIKIKRNKVEATDQDIEKTLDELREMRATEILVEREAKKGDRVEIDFDVSIDNVPIEGGQAKKYSMILGNGNFIPGFEEQVEGMKTNEEKTFKLTFPKEYHDQKVKGKEAEFKVKLLSVFERKLPEINDEFAKQLGNYQSVNDLKDQIKKNILEDKELKENQRTELEMMEKIIEQSKFDDIPELLLNSETEKMMHELEHNVTQQGLSFDDYLNHLKKDKNQLKLDFMPQALKRVKSAIVLSKVFQAQDIKIEDKEVDDLIENEKKMYQNNPEVIERIESKDYREYLYNILANRKAIDLLKKACIEE